MYDKSPVTTFILFLIVFGGPIFIIWAIIKGVWKYRKEKEETIPEIVRAANEKGYEIITLIYRKFLVQPCFNCHEYKMRLLNISPNGRSIQYQCVHCERKMRAAAGTLEATMVGEIWREYSELIKQCLSAPWILQKYPLMPLEFETVPAPMPYEQTTRTPIPEAIRAEVWRRDQGCCVICGSKENLHFDHIIPVSRGGSTTAKNLQILCQSCNLAKGAKI